MARGSKRGFRNRHDGRSFRGGGQFSNYKQRGGFRAPPPNFFAPPAFGFPAPDFSFPRGMGARFPARIPMAPSFRMMRGGMPNRRGSSKKHKQQPKKSRNLVTLVGKHKSKLMEKDVGITEYVSTHEGFGGIIKQRFSDFHVNEITSDGTMAKLTDLEPPVDVENKKSESEIVEILTPEVMEKLKTMVETKNGVVEIEVTEKSKDDRRKIHEAVKDAFGTEVYSNTEDREEKKFITIYKTKKGVLQDRRLRWPAERGGVYVHFILHKENMDTQETVNYLAGKLGVKPNFITYAGTKDRRAMTSQMMSVFKIDPARLALLSNELRGVTLGNYSFKPTCLKLGDLKGNRFRITLRNVTGTDEQIDEAMNNIKEKGFINYYGLQRFGSSSYVPTPKVGKALLLGQWKEAIELILKPRNIEEPRAIKRARQIWWIRKDARRAAHMLRKNFRNSIESKLLQGIFKHDPEDFVGALQNIPRNTRLLYMHSYQSLVWNNIVSRRIKEFGLKPMVGDLVFVNNEEYQEVVDQEGSDIVTDEFPKRPRKKAKKAAAAASEAGSSTAGDDANKDAVNSSEETTSNAEEKATGDSGIKSDSGHTSDKSLDTAADNSLGSTDVKREGAVDADVEESTCESVKEENSEKEVFSDPLCEYSTKTPSVRAITEEDLERVKIEDVVLPLPGHNVKYPENVVKEWYEEMLAVDGLSFTSMKKNIRQYSVSGTYRRMLIRPENLTWKTMRYSSLTSSLIRSDLDELKKVPEPQDDPEGKYRALLLDFCLPSSTYATMALREIIKVDTSSVHQASLNNYHIVAKEEGKSDKTSTGGDESNDSDGKMDTTPEAEHEAEIKEEEEEDDSTGRLKRKADDEDANEKETDSDLTEVKKVKVEDQI